MSTGPFTNQPNLPTYGLSFGDMLEFGKHLAAVPEFRSAWLHTFIHYAPYTVVHYALNLLVHDNDGAWGNM